VEEEKILAPNNKLRVPRKKMLSIAVRQFSATALAEGRKKKKRGKFHRTEGRKNSPEGGEHMPSGAERLGKKKGGGFCRNGGSREKTSIGMKGKRTVLRGKRLLQKRGGTMWKPHHARYDEETKKGGKKERINRQKKEKG